MNKRVISKGNLIKETNYKKILQLIGKGQNLTKLDIAYTLKISIPTVTTNINEMKQEGIIDEVESDIYTGGRKPKVIKVIPNSRLSIGMSITKSKVIVTVMNLLEQVLLIKEAECTNKAFEEYLKEGKRLIRECVEALEINESAILGVGISIPGTLNQKFGVIEQTNMGFKDIHLDDIYDTFDITVYVENEANLSLLAEKSIGKQIDLKNLMYIGINEGLGGGIFVNGELFTGNSGRAGEFGHMCFIEKQTGKRYRVEDKISTGGLVQHYIEQTGQNIDSFKDFEKLVRTQDTTACHILIEGIETLLMTIYNLTMVLDIHKIIIGGKVGRLIKAEPTLLNLIMNKYREILDRLDIDIIFSEIRHSSSIGAALLPIIDFYKVNNENE